MSGSPVPVDVHEPEVRHDREHLYLRVHAINVFVRDQDESLKFYLDQLGFSLVGDVRFGSGERWVAVAPPDGSTVLSLIAPKPDSRDAQFVGRPTHVVFVTEDVVSKYQEWRKRGVRFSCTPRLKRVSFERQGFNRNGVSGASNGKHAPIWGGAITYFKDPDGNSFALVSYDEESRAVEAQRRSVAAKFEAERRAAQELEIAKQVQMRLFPQTLPLLSTLDYAGVCIQARQVGGDYYDFLDLGRGRLGLVVADVAGKGIAAALLMANLQANLRSQCATASDEPHRFLQSLNRLFYANSTDSAYATLFFAEYDDHSRCLRYSNCGHLSALLLRRDGRLERLESTSTVLGLFEEWDCMTAERVLSGGDTLVLYTDGITEACNRAGDEYGEKRVIESLRRCCDGPAAEVVEAMVEDARRFCPDEQADDITLIVAKGR